MFVILQTKMFISCVFLLLEPVFSCKAAEGFRHPKCITEV